LFWLSVNWPDWNVTMIFRFFFRRCLKWQPKRSFMAMTNMFWDYLVLSFMNINSKEREITTNSTSTRRRTRSQKTSGSLCSKLEVFIWRHVVYVPKSSTTFRGILICVNFKPRDMQEYYVIRDLRKGCGFIFPVYFLYRLSRFPIHECLFILCIAYLSLCTFYRGVSWNRPRLYMTLSVIDEYYFYHGFGLKVFERRHIRIIIRVCITIY
jgi:hypothetical protein